MRSTRATAAGGLLRRPGFLSALNERQERHEPPELAAVLPGLPGHPHAGAGEPSCSGTEASHGRPLVPVHEEFSQPAAIER